MSSGALRGLLEYGQMKKRRQWFRDPFRLFLACLFMVASKAPAQQLLAPAQSPLRPLHQEGIYLVFPFENSGATPRLDWIGEGLEEASIQRLSAAGQQVYAHTARLNEMDRYGLPASAKLSRATMLRIAEELDADYVVFGNFASDGKALSVNARVLRVSPLALLPVVHESGALDSLMDLHTRLVWRLLKTCDRKYPLSLPEFTKLQRPPGLAAFEQYIRGLLANDDEVRLRDLKEAVRLEPDWPDPVFALGEVYFHRNDCPGALPWFARVPATHERSVEAVFSTGVCRLRMGQPDKAEEVFKGLQENLRHNMVSGADLPEILNNLAVAESRQSNLEAARTALGRAREIDPDEDSYPFNLALMFLRTNDLAAAEMYFREALHREPDNPENMAFLIYAIERAGKKQEAAGEREAAVQAFGEKGLPLLKIDSKNRETIDKYARIKRVLDTTSLQLELKGPDVQHAVSAEAAGSKDSFSDRLRRGRQELGAGRLDNAEREFREVLAGDPQNASAHRELAEIFRRRNKLDEAVKELQLSLVARDSAVVRVMLARIYIEAGKPDLAKAEAQKAIKLAPNYAEAQQLLERLQKSKSAGGAR